MIHTEIPLGDTVPPNTKYAVSVSLPKWDDNVDYEEGKARVVDVMVSGYPRFFIAVPIQKLVEYMKDRFALPGETAMLFPSRACAERCSTFIYNQAPKQHESIKCKIPKPGQVRIVEYTVEPINRQAAAFDSMHNVLDTPVVIYCVLFLSELFPLAKQYWQHTGDGISARFADYCLHIVRINEELEDGDGTQRARAKYCSSGNTGTMMRADIESGIETDAYLEERFGRNLDPKYSAKMKLALRHRISGALTDEERHGSNLERGVAGLTPDDVYLITTGMGAIFHAHQCLLKVRPGKSICFGFPYTDTLKILQKFGPGAYFLGQGEGSDYDELERILERHVQIGDPILAIFTECPSNPLLKTADLPRIRALADKYNASLVIDETIGSIVNVNVLEWADIVVSSLTKVFSGDSNVMGGSIVLNPGGSIYSKLRSTMDKYYEDLMWCEDVIFLERNSRDFVVRVAEINRNALAVCELLRSSPKVSQINYPKYITPENYEKIKRDTSLAGYGGLFSVIFSGGEPAAKVFYDHLVCCKGPSLGTNFTLASPYTILAHFGELEWAKRYGVRSDLVRISVGLEPQTKLLEMFQMALDAIPSDP